MEHDLSRRVAEKMGWVRQGTHLWFGPDHKYYSKAPSYATDLNLALTIIPDDMILTIESPEAPGGEWGVWFKKKGTFTSWFQADANLAAAICKAGLRALGEEG